MGISNFVDNYIGAFFDGLRKGVNRRLLEDARKRSAESLAKEPAKLIKEANSAIETARSTDVDSAKIRVMESDLEKYQSGEIDSRKIRRSIRTMRDEIEFKVVLMHNRI